MNSRDYSPQEIRVWSGRTSAERFRSSHGKVRRYVAVERGKIVGFGDFSREDPEEYWGLYVHKDFLGRGIGTRLMEKLQKTAQGMGAKKFRLVATKTAEGFYRKLGFRLVRRAKHKIGDQRLDVLIMERRWG